MSQWNTFYLNKIKTACNLKKNAGNKLAIIHSNFLLELLEIKIKGFRDINSEFNIYYIDTKLHKKLFNDTSQLLSMCTLLSFIILVG